CKLDEIEADAAATVRQQFFTANAIMEDAYQTMDPTTWFGAQANRRILAILGQAPSEDAAIAAFERLAHTFTTWWDADTHRGRGRDDRGHERNYWVEPTLSHLLQNFLLRTSATAASAIVQPLLDAVDRHPREVQSFLLGLTSAEDRQPNTPQFW